MRCEPVQQFGMRWPFALCAEITRSFYQARAEELLPKAVHCHARRERMLRADKPAREIKAIRGLARWQRRQRGGHGPRNRVAALIILAALEQECLAGFF